MSTYMYVCECMHVQCVCRGGMMGGICMHVQCVCRGGG